MKISVPINQTYHEEVNEKTKLWESKRNERYKEYREKWVSNPQKFIVEKAPLHLDIEPTNACNLKCPMCPRTVLIDSDCSKFNISTMDLDFFKMIIDQATDIGVYSIKLNWLGEPLLNKNLVEMIKYAKDKGIVDVMLNTNAVLLDEKMSKGLIEAGLDKLFFSFDSPVKEKYEEIRVGAKFEDTLNNIKQFMELRNSMNTDTPFTRVLMVMMESNQNEYNQFVDLFKDIVDAVAYGDYQDPVSGETVYEYNENFVCSQLWQRMFIAADGEVIVCCMDNTREYVVGNVNYDSIAEIWKNEKYQKIRDLHMHGKYNEIPMCSKCDITISQWDEI